MPVSVPETAQRDRQTELLDDVAPGVRPLQRGAQVVVVNLQAAEPARLLRVPQPGLDLLGPGEEVVPLPVARRFAILARAPLLRRILADRLQEMVARAAGSRRSVMLLVDHQRL